MRTLKQVPNPNNLWLFSLAFPEFSFLGYLKTISEQISARKAKKLGEHDFR